MLRTVAGFGRPNNHREVNQRMAKTDARSPRTERGTIALQDASQDIWDKKYRLKSKDGTPVDASVDGTWQRVARALADVEEKASREHWYGRFLWALRNGAIPAGRIISNAGALGHKPATSTINCTVSGTIQDSMDNILEKVHEAGLTLKAGCGIGYEFSTLRPRGAYVGKRRHGMGFLGLGSTLTLLKLRYGSPEACVFTEEVAREMALVGWEVALELAREKGPAPILAQDYEVTAEMLRKRPEMAADGYKAGDRIRGSVLHAKYSRYMQRVAEHAPELIEALAETGARFTHHSSIAPTGTISLSLANNASNGIEPSFAHHYSRNLIREGRKTKEKVEVYSYELLAYRTLVNAQALPDSDDPARRLPDYFITADSVTPAQHVDIQAAAQKWVDSSISKTANVPTDYPFEDFKDIYRYAWHQGLKGCTTFRFNPEAFQGVLVKESDLEKTRYRFELEDGSVVEFKGNEQVEYDGEIHTAANLFDALKEGYYGKY